ncbi:MAG: DUF1343 domain-containing protein [candidate division KSB1 bacterium]|nr:DUF1343 domain-containing protein [candidate division KSB1 bacterium]MDZ7275514.1 DUF1343 domain-containing protein [candidate division KSB1 bacterium]MDZ7286174.1 DUF1343 domain-containing protein [candidate division KSB1 bacterium]MDZ7296400.1 DUF1343 domain-containing protein [candidate division KSB1 bacterium]MDZ7306235.1 DUF1343 domain-containing protein [candidate division KSB1 bacterium]
MKTRNPQPLLLVLIFLLPAPALFSQTNPPVLTGLDRIVADSFRVLRGKRLGVITNQTGVDRSGRHIVDLLHHARDVKLVALFGPEHGIRGQAPAGEKVGSAVDSATGIPVYSLYGAHRKPTPAMLAGLEALVFDIQDVGARFYTYISTMALAMEAAAEAGLEFYVLDRPNPLGDRVEGPLLAVEHRSFVGIHPIALQHGMTVGELARMFLGEGWITAAHDSGAARASWSKLQVIPVANWRRQQFHEATGLHWIPPSPNIPDAATALLYPGTCLLEATNVSEGRGTHRPFSLIGAPWLDAGKLAPRLRGLVEGVAVEAVEFVPGDIPGKAMNPKYEGQTCAGLALRVTDPQKFPPVKFGVALLHALQQLHPAEFRMRRDGMARLAGVSWLQEMIASGAPLAEIWQRLDDEAEGFRRLRQKYLLYE